MYIARMVEMIRWSALQVRSQSKQECLDCSNQGLREGVIRSSSYLGTVDTGARQDKSMYTTKFFAINLGP